MIMDTDIIEAYFEAWDLHDCDAILETYANGGSYSDPATGGKLEGAAIAEYAQALFTAFPDMSIEYIGSVEANSGLIAAPWIIFGTHDGPLMGNEATGNKIVLPGCDFIKTTEGGLIESVEGLWDIKDLYQQLGLSTT